jgi:hypothetical protein
VDAYASPESAESFAFSSSASALADARLRGRISLGGASAVTSSSSSLLAPTGDPVLDRIRAEAAEQRRAAREAKRKSILADVAARAGVRVQAAEEVMRGLHVGVGGRGQG